MAQVRGEPASLHLWAVSLVVSPDDAMQETAVSRATPIQKCVGLAWDSSSGDDDTYRGLQAQRSMPVPPRECQAVSTTTTTTTSRHLLKGDHIFVSCPAAHGH